MAVLAVLALPVLLAIVMVIGMCGGYVAGSLFDSVMGTNIAPILTVGMLILGFDSSSNKGKGTSNGIGKLIGTVVLLPFITLFGAFIADVLFPQTTQAFLDMVSYEGSIYGLAFLGSLTMAVVKSVVSIILLVAMLPLMAILSRKPRAA